MVKPTDRMLEYPKAYEDYFLCPKCGYENVVLRRKLTAGRTVLARCHRCHKRTRTKAGAL